ncbi:MAG: hypothetical protein LBV67_09715, partial [Streptococcaceae bacterium]|nr:hypothetical protein [Streptococcaceae bacterium]
MTNSSNKLTNLQAVRDSSRRLVKVGVDENVAQFVFLNRKKWNLTSWLLRMNDEITPEDLIQLRKDEAKLYNHVP